MAYLPFPSSWTVSTLTDKVGNWLEAYASLMEGNIWMDNITRGTDYNEETSNVASAG